VTIACSIIAAWLLLFYHACWQVRLVDGGGGGSTGRSHWADVLGTFLLLEFANTGLFITTHDAMHGTICYRWVRAGTARVLAVSS
jgi:fatty acid desaturase